MILILEFQQTVCICLIVYLAVVGLPRQKAEVESVGQRRNGSGGERRWRVVAVSEGGGEGGWRRRRVAEAEGAEYDAVSSLYPHCIPSKRGRRRWVAAAVVEGGGWWAVAARG